MKVVSEEREKHHCDICLEIREGCEDDFKCPVKCSVCDRVGYFNLPSGVAVVCVRVASGDSD